MTSAKWGKRYREAIDIAAGVARGIKEPRNLFLEKRLKNLGAKAPTGMTPGEQARLIYPENTEEINRRRDAYLAGWLNEAASIVQEAGNG